MGLIHRTVLNHGYHPWRMAWHIIKGHNVHGTQFADDYPSWVAGKFGYHCECGEGFGINLEPKTTT